MHPLWHTMAIWVEKPLALASIMEEVKQYHRNLAVVFYDYRKAYDKVHHDWMVRVYHWIGIPKEVITLISELMEKWKTRLEIWSRSEKLTSRWIDISCGFLQGDSYSPVGFCNKVKITGHQPNTSVVC